MTADEPATAPEQTHEPAPTTRAADFARARGHSQLADEEARVTQRLYERLTPPEIATVEAAIGANYDLAANFDHLTDQVIRHQRLLAFGVYLGDERVLAGTGLPFAQPPEDVHQMDSGPFAAAGGLYEADLVVDALASAGVEPQQIHSALDFGCSSGRVLRVLNAAYPEIEWHGCDPNEPAIAWAGANLTAIDFFVNADAPPLHLGDASLDLAYAISIWSHFEPALGLRWFEEMHRILRPGAHLVCTTHGLPSVAYYATRELRTPEQSREIADALYRHGWWYAAEFGEEGDWGVVNPAWGTAFLSPEWMLSQLCPRWRVLEFAPGRNQGNQDVYVLQRV